ncbi:hypothetical protein F3Y22_tig00110044pilonHSYRG00243 [Hibiscus syriacus]|uniref:Uncharacterized protein n=1 Tax=Hibiscus syriacus TaxID=106335 RepID=A0A6A3BP32_HIBSY|nr:hypothetical protein F3Y22_tig00110044pilonHSYRG00243 [Hibiscus syriacus]
MGASLLWLHGLELDFYYGTEETKDSLKVTSPSSIEGVYESSITSFGIPLHGGTLVGRVVYPEPNKRGCRPFDEDDVYFKSSHGALPTVLLVDRGDCFFALKAWHAQHAGATAVLVADYIDMPLITMNTPKKVYAGAEYVQNITIPSALITKSLGNSIKEALSNHELSTSFGLLATTNAGRRATASSNSSRTSKELLKYWSRKGTHVSPSLYDLVLPSVFCSNKQCNSQCINRGQYCAPDLGHDPDRGYGDKDVMVQNLRQACFFKIPNESGTPWLWWDYVTDFVIRCPSKEKSTKECADKVIRSLGIGLAKIDNCIGKLDKGAVLKAICAGFQDTIEYWEDSIANITACRDTFRRRVECSIVNGVKYSGNGYTLCKSKSISLARNSVSRHKVTGRSLFSIILGLTVAGVTVHANYKQTILVRSLPL